jgi:hypothetical protein
MALVPESRLRRLVWRCREAVSVKFCRISNLQLEAALLYQQVEVVGY